MIRIPQWMVQLPTTRLIIRTLISLLSSLRPSMKASIVSNCSSKGEGEAGGVGFTHSLVPRQKRAVTACDSLFVRGLIFVLKRSMMQLI